jgi:hypothetical protein
MLCGLIAQHPNEPVGYVWMSQCKMAKYDTMACATLISK